MQVVIHFLTASVERTAGEAVHQAAIRNPCCNPCRNPCLARQRGTCTRVRPEKIGRSSSASYYRELLRYENTTCDIGLNAV